jgi:hypothetical protein
VRNEYLRQRRVFAQDADHRVPIYSHDLSIHDRSRGRDLRGLPGQAILAQKITPREHRDHALLALRRKDGDLDPALPDEEDRVRRIALTENDRAARVSPGRRATADLID